VAREAEVEGDGGEIAARLRHALQRGLEAQPQEPAMYRSARRLAEGPAELEGRTFRAAGEIVQGEPLIEVQERVCAHALNDVRRGRVLRRD
jgi:hypothetical protein